jgi:hypothetical protein
MSVGGVVFTVGMGNSRDVLDAVIDTAVGLLAAPLGQLVFPSLSITDSLHVSARIEELGRIVDAARVRSAADIAARVTANPDLFAAHGYRSAVDAIAARTGVSERTAKTRITTGAGIAATLSLSGAVVEPRYPVLADAVSSGTIGTEAAGVLVRELDAVAARVDPVNLDTAEAGLVALAAATDTTPPTPVDLVRMQAKAFVAVIDPDGARPREERMIRRRSFTIGREDEDGLVPIRGRLTLDVGTQLKRCLDSMVRSVSFRDASASSDGWARPEGDGGSDRPATLASGDSKSGTTDTHTDTDASETDTPDTDISDTRTREQKLHDAFASLVGAASRVVDAPELAGASPAVLVTVTQDTLDGGRGVGFLDGTDTPISVGRVERYMDAGGFQTVSMDARGRVLSLSSVQRCFTPSQRRAITARDGGCIIPGCRIPAGLCEIHHVIAHRHGGKTIVDNGVLLCWWHHHTIDTGPWRIDMPHGTPHIHGPGYRQWTPTTKSRVRPARPPSG